MADVAASGGLMRPFSAMVEYCLDQRHRLLAILFVAYGFSGCIATAVVMPPYVNPDEPAHFQRADAISLGGLLGKRLSPDRTGGFVHDNIRQAAVIIWSVIKDPARRIDSQVRTRSDAFRWNDTIAYQDFPNTAAYPPTSYVPTVLGIWLGRAVDLSVNATLVLARCLNAFVYVAIGAVAIVGSGSAAPLLFSVLLLPESISQAAAVTQDGWLFALSALAISLALPSLRERRDVGRRRTLLLGLTLLMLVAARPAYLPLAVMPLLLRGTSLRFRLACVAGITATCILWAAAVAMFVVVPFPNLDSLGPPNASRQLQLLLQHPGMIGPVAIRTLTTFRDVFYIQFIGLGAWLLPLDFYAAAWSVVLVSALLGVPTRGRSAWHWHAASIAGLILSASVLIFMACYVAFTAPGAPEVWGMQGRYFIPLALLVPGLLPAVRMGGQAVQALALGVVASFPAISIAALLHAIVWRFYLGV